MKNIKKYIGNIITGITFTIGIDSYRRVLNSEVNDKFTNNLLEETIRKSTEIIDKLNEDKINNVDIESKLGKVKTYLEEIESKTKVISDIGTTNNNLSNETTKDLIIESNSSLKDSIFKANEIIDDIFKLINGSNNNSNNYLSNYIDSLYNYFLSLNSIQLSLISHILLSICIFFLL
jgi:hypothetical protein